MALLHRLQQGEVGSPSSFSLGHSKFSLVAYQVDVYSNEEFYNKTLLLVTLKITVAWGWSMFFANSLMTGGIIYKIM